AGTGVPAGTPPAAIARRTNAATTSSSGFPSSGSPSSMSPSCSSAGGSTAATGRELVRLALGDAEGGGHPGRCVLRREALGEGRGDRGLDVVDRRLRGGGR